MTKSAIMIDLDDPRTAKIADVISNKTSKRILSALAEEELSESELAKKIELPLNTIGYNTKKLEEAGLIEKVKGFYWSEKGKKIYKYKVSNKRIIISPQSLLRGVIPALLASLIIALVIGVMFNAQQPIETKQTMISEKSGGAAGIASDSAEAYRILPPQPPTPAPSKSFSGCNNAWAWFMLGALVAILIFLLWNTYQMKGGKKK